MADATFTVDANTIQLLVKAKAAEQAFRNVGKGIKDSGDAIQKAGTATSNAFEKAAMSMGRTLIGAQAIGHALAAARDRASELVTKIAEAGGVQGGVSLRGSLAAARGGLNQQAAEAFINQISPVSQESRASLLEGLAGLGIPISAQDQVGFQQAGASGAFSNDEILAAARNGQTLNVQERLAQLTPGARRELQTLTAIDAQSARNRSVRSDALRIGEVGGQAADLANPRRASARSAIETVDFTGLGQAMVQSENAKRAQLAMEQTANAVKQIANNTRGTLNTSGMTDNQ